MNQLIAEIERKSWLAERDSDETQDQVVLHPEKIGGIEDWGYPPYLSRLKLMAAELEQLNFQCDFLPNPVISEVLGRVEGLIDAYNTKFAQQIGGAFPAWAASNKDRPPLTVDFLETTFFPPLSKIPPRKVTVRLHLHV